MTTAKVYTDDSAGRLGVANLSNIFNELGEYYYQKETDLLDPGFKVISIGRASIVGDAKIGLWWESDGYSAAAGWDYPTIADTSQPTLKIKKLLSWGGQMVEKSNYDTPKTKYFVPFEKITSIGIFNDPSTLPLDSHTNPLKKRWGQVDGNWTYGGNPAIFNYKRLQLDIGSQIRASETIFKDFYLNIW